MALVSCDSFINIGSQANSINSILSLSSFDYKLHLIGHISPGACIVQYSTIQNGIFAFTEKEILHLPTLIASQGLKN